jgi:hypothetical protein
MILVYALETIYSLKNRKDVIQINTLNPYKGVPTENIVTRLYQMPIVTNSQFQKEDENIKAIIIKSTNIQHNFENFVKVNFHHLEYIKEALELENVYDIFDITKIQLLKRNFDVKIDMKIEERFNEFISKIEYDHLIIDINDLEKTLANVNILKFNKGNDKKNDKKIDKKNIKFTMCELNYGFGDFLQRYARILNKFLKFSETDFELVKTHSSYSNRAHGSAVLNLKKFPAFDHIPFIDSKKTTRISLMTFLELIVFDKKFFNNWNEDFVLEIDLSSTPGLGRSKNPNYNYLTNEHKNMILREPSTPVYKVPQYLQQIKKEDNRVIFHFRRNDYVDMILSNSRSARTMNSFQHLFKNFVKKVKQFEEKSYNVVIISDHYYKKIVEHQKKYERILFDYNYIDIGTTFEYDSIKIKIVDKIIGKDEIAERKFIEEILRSKYLIGNQSCLPNLLTETLNSDIKNISRDIVPNIRNTNDLDTLLKDPECVTESFKKYCK